jgi:catechol 2,3-dioxygenase-like lactoylglutathione lyase family enzyme
MSQTPVLFRIILQVPDLPKAAEFYERLLGDPGRTIPRASRHYIDCGPVILALVDPTAEEEAKPLPDYIYFAVDNLDEIYQRARELNCLSTDDVHGDPAGEIAVRPWGERSFYVDDPWSNGLCFVDNKTLFTGR